MLGCKKKPLSGAEFSQLCLYTSREPYTL